MEVDRVVKRVRVVEELYGSKLRYVFLITPEKSSKELIGME